MKKIRKLLVVDDDNDLRNLLCSYLLSQDFSVYGVNDVHSALVIIKKDRPDLIITDVMMKKLDGYDFIKLLKLDILLMDIPVIFLTAKGMTYDRIKGYNLGCHAYLTKPFNPEELLSIINNIFHHINLSILNYNAHQFSVNNHNTFSFSYINFTFREKTVLKLVLQGYMNKEISIILNVSIRNIEKYVSRLLNKTKTRNRTELVKFILSL